MAKKNNVCVEPQEEKKKKRGSKAVKATIITLAFGLLASTVAGLSVALYYSNRTLQTHESYQRQMDAVYFKAYYDLIDGANDMGVTLRKIGVSNTPSMQQSMLYEVWSAAELAENSLGVFEAASDGLVKAQKFVNQLGDYAHALALRISDGEALTEEEKATLAKLGDVAQAYLRALERLKESVDEGKLFVGEGGALDGVEDAFSEFAEPSFAYPEMIYDGPFSDALENRAPKGLGGEEISEERGKELVAKMFECSDIAYLGEGEGDIPTLNFSFEEEGANAFVQLAKRGGALVSYNRGYADDALPSATEEAGASCQRAALEFASKMGFEDMQVVWSSSADGECVINLAPVRDGVILYPDLVKIKVRENGSVVTGADASHYALNHAERTLPAPALSEAEAAKALSVPADSEGKLSLIPLRGTREYLAYEFECHVGDATYYVYVDAATGKEINILYVLDDSRMGARTV